MKRRNLIIFCRNDNLNIKKAEPLKGSALQVYTSNHGRIAGILPYNLNSDQLDFENRYRLAGQFDPIAVDFYPDFPAARGSLIGGQVGLVQFV